MFKDSEIIYLSDLKFPSVIPNSQPSSSTNPIFSTSSQATAPAAPNQPSTGFSRPKPHERLAADKIGEELAPDAGIWQIYLDEAKEHDDELVDSKNENLDMMLLFAALFSAILTAFLIESKNLLQQDPAEVSIGLLLAIAQSQQRLEQGSPQTTSVPVELPEFSVPTSARWINGLWFLSLAFSLSAALVAMLAKEWLTAYNTSRSRSAHTYALERQARLEGLSRWRALHIIDLLPSMLHFALLLFSFGLILYLSTLDSGIAAVIGVVTALTFLFYVATAFFGAIYEFCPFITQISKYIHQGLLFYSKDWIIRKGHLGKREKHPAEDTTDEDLHALIWLAENARDPAAGDCSYQALAGSRLKLPESGADAVLQKSPEKPEGKAVTTGVTSDGRANTIQVLQSSSSPANEYTLVHGLFKSVHARLSRALIQQPRELAACQGINVARYANALPKLVEFLQIYSDQQLADNDMIGEITKSTSETSAQAAFDALDTIWCHECPPLSTDSYALLTSAELRLTITAAAPYLRQALPQHMVPDALGPVISPASRTTHEEGSHVTQDQVEIIIDLARETPADSRVRLFDLRARYSRALSRAAYLLSYHAKGRAPIGADALIHLLSSIRDGAGCDHLNPESQLSTHQSQSRPGVVPTIQVRMIGMGDHCYVDPDMIGDEDSLLVGLLKLLASLDAQINPGLDQGAEDAINAISPILLQQWLNMSEPKAENEGAVAESGAKLTATTWSQLTNRIRYGLITDGAAWQALAIATVVVPYAGHSGIGELPERAICTLYRRLKTDPSRWRAHFTFDAQSDLMGQLLSLVDQHLSELSQATLEWFTNIFSIEYRNQSYFQNPGIVPASVPPFLRILSEVPGQASELQKLLAVLEDKFQTSSLYLEQLTDSEAGFNALLKIGEREEYRLIVAKCVAGIIKGAIPLGRRRSIKTQALPGYFEAVAFAFGVLQSDEEGADTLLASACNVHLPLNDLPDDTAHLLSTHAAIGAIHDALQAVSEPSEKQKNLLAELEELRSWSDINDLPLRGLAPFFERISNERYWDELFSGW